MLPRCSLKTRLWSFHRGKLTWGTLPHPSNHPDTTATPPCQKVTSCLRKLWQKHPRSMHLSLAWDFSFRSSTWAIWIIHALSSNIFLYKNMFELRACIIHIAHVDDRNEKSQARLKCIDLGCFCQSFRKHDVTFWQGGVAVVSGWLLGCGSVPQVSFPRWKLHSLVFREHLGSISLWHTVKSIK